ncbi:MAG: haloacid dehalogenase type II [Pseudomonadota bacterium]|nr:haloacid dehalogenase type II [Pseudomonadota bacterium]
MTTAPVRPKILAFDIFGTVVDWHGSIVREVEALGLLDGPDCALTPADFARAWRAGYRPAMARVMSGELGWTRIDDLHRMILDELLDQYHLALDEPGRRQLNLAWHRLAPWPDSVEGLTRLKQRHVICTLSNGNLGLLAEMAKLGGLPWDLILSAEVFRAYKPHPDTYLGVAEVFEVDPSEVMLVAAHQDDLDAARGCGLKTAYIERPHEFGADAPKSVEGSSANDLHASSLTDLARALQC